MKKTVFLNTCAFGAGKKMSDLPELSKKYGDKIGFEILSMFGDDGFEESLKEIIPGILGNRIGWHGPVLEAEHSAARDTPEYYKSMYYVQKTLHYCKLTHSDHFTMHLNNCVCPPEKKAEMLHNACENYKELEEMFGAIDCKIYVENTGTIIQHNNLLTQEEFTQLCIDKKYNVLIDVGHANACSWDIYKLISDLNQQICAYHLHNNDGIHDLHHRIHDGTIDFGKLMTYIKDKTPEADWIIEYTNSMQNDAGMRTDFEELFSIR